jgi:ankyrin repeat protein
MRCPAELRSNQPLLWSPGTGRQVWEMLRAARAGDVPTLRRLLEQNAALARCHYQYRTPLEFAVRSNQLAAVQLLLGYQADGLSLEVHQPLLTLAAESGFAAMRALLEAHLPASDRGEPIAAAIRARDLRQVRRLLNADPSLLTAPDPRGNLPIHWAAMTRQLKIIDELQSRGADLNAQRPDGARPIQLANGDYLFRGWRDVPAETRTTPRQVIDHLRKRGAECDICTACYIGDLDHVTRLLAADPSLANRPSPYITYYPCSGTPLRNAAAAGHRAIVELLLAHGADPNLRIEGIAPLGQALHEAVCHRHRAIVELLLAHGAHPNVPVESSADTLSAALRNQDDEMVALLASHGAARSLEILAYYGDIVPAAAMLAANPKLANDPGALVCAAEEGHEPFVRLLLHHRPQLAKQVGVGGKTPAITELLFAHGMDPNHRDWLAVTPLHRFARGGDVANAELFLARGARRYAIDDDLRLTPLGWAERYRQPAMAALLRA